MSWRSAAPSPCPPWSIWSPSRAKRAASSGPPLPQAFRHLVEVHAVESFVTELLAEGVETEAG